MGIISHILGQEAQILSTERDFYGDQREISRETVKCRFRYITQTDKQYHAEGLTTSDAIIWFNPNVTIEEGNIVKVDGKFWRIDKLIRARRMSGSSILFLKAFVKTYEAIEAS